MADRTMIDLRSDTVTKPTEAMREAMATADVGDDQYGEDPTVNALEARAAELLGKEAAVFVASGTMGNLSSVLAHCQRGDEVILGDEAHILWYESAGPATVGGISPRTIHNLTDATFDLDELESAVRENRDGFPPTGLICVENTHNRCGGAVLPLEHLQSVREIADRHGLPVHMDGARIFNASAALGVSAAEIASHVDSVQFCLSKGLAAPVGSLVTGSAAFVQRVRRYRKLLGGAMRQSGVIAAAGLVAFETMIDRLPEDHRRARQIAEAIAVLPGFSIDPERVQTNIVVFKPAASIDKAAYMDALRQEGVLVSDYGLRGLRIVTHYQISDDDVAAAIAALGRAVQSATGEQRVLA
ncbi:MAG TPA: low-specificity L-threonine aldolase [Thermomicrobiales bacterium]|nr:low-specificity L-threonine aldolase [Thermomicrobiales bacterium]